MDEVQAAVIQWRKSYEAILEFNTKTSQHYTNVTIARDRIRDLANSINTNIHSFKVTINQYLQDNRNEIWLRYWIQDTSESLLHKLNGYRYLISFTVNPMFEQEWSAVENIIFPDSYDTLYKNALSILSAVHSKKSLLECDDPTIMAVHEGKECQDNSWGCGMCDRMSYTWNQKLIKEALNTNNIFLNTKLQEEFIQYAKNVIVVPDSWEPVKKYTSPVQITHIPGGTAIQNLRELIGSMYTWGLSYRLNTRSHYSTFMSLWSYLDEIAPVLDNDLRYLADL